MIRVGIAANPAASKDIRRVVSHASSVSNNEKSNIVRRILLGLAATGIDEVVFMPDSAELVPVALKQLKLPFPVRMLEGDWRDHTDDTTLAAHLCREQEVRCLITLGGDGTARAAVKGARDLPLLALSTGTNNAFPVMLEGTLAGLAAGAYAMLDTPLQSAPLLEIWRNNELVDVALIDVAAVDDVLGGRAVWEMERVRTLVTTQITPHTIGLSSIGGFLGVEPAAESVAVGIELGAGRTIHAPIAPGVIAPVNIATHAWLKTGDQYDLPTNAALALDGEREWMSRDGEAWQVRVVADGVRRLDVAAALARWAKR